MKPEQFFSEDEKSRIISAIKEAELATSGEICVFIENHCKADVFDRAAKIFSRMKIHKTKLRDGVLIYLALVDRKFAILGDVGINAVTPDDFWDKIKETMEGHFRTGNFTEGLVNGIRMSGDALKEKFPHLSRDVNELADEIRFGKEENE
jgi:uncharacterized membrane protein